MPKYYFDVLLDTGMTIDQFGTDLPSAAAAEREAAVLLVELLRDKHYGGGSASIEVIVRSENDEPPLAAQLSVEVKLLPQQPQTQTD